MKRLVKPGADLFDSESIKEVLIKAKDERKIVILIGSGLFISVCFQ